jgi:HK97 gp10 family phage protein
MVGKVTVKVAGLRELDAALGELPKATAKAVLRRVGIKALQPVAERARELAPDDPETGGNDLRSSIGVGARLSPRQAKLNRKAIRTGEAEKYFQEVYAGAGPVPHAHLQEFGTAHHAPQPFLRPAWESGKAGVLETVKTELGGEIDKAAKRVAARAAKKAAKG